MTRSVAQSVAQGLGLVAVLGFVFMVQFAPHLHRPVEPMPAEGTPIVRLVQAGAEYATGDRTGYAYPLHVDEHLHWAWISSIQRQDQVRIDYPYTGVEPHEDAFLSLRGAIHERGFQLTMAMVQEITGVNFRLVFLYLPAAWMAFTAFAVYALLRPSPAALPAAAFVALVPTSVRFLGPAFLVPIGFCLAWLPAALLLVPAARRRTAAAVLLFAVVGWAFFIHLIGGFAAVGLVILSAIGGSRREIRSTLVLLAIALVPLIWIYRTFTGDVQYEIDREENLPIDFTIFDQFGPPALYAWAAGLVLLVMARPRVARQATYALSAFSVIALAMILASVAFDWGKYATYTRWHPPFFLAAAIPVGHGLGVLFEAVKTIVAGASPGRLDFRRAGTAIGSAAVLLSAVLVSSTGVHGHLEEPYYQVIDDRDWLAFNSVARNVGPEYEVFLTHPWKAPVLTALTGKYPRAVLLPGAPPVNGEDYIFYAQTGGTLEFFIKNDITLVIASGKPPLPEFESLGPNVWGIKRDIAEEIYKIRLEERGG